MAAGHCPLGMYILPSKDKLSIWDGVLFVHQGYYADAVLKFRLTFPDNYPDRPPSVQFIAELFHPLISQEGAFSISHRFRPWRPREHHVFDILHFIKSAFKEDLLGALREEDCANKEAFRLYHRSPQSFASLAAQSVHLSQSESALFDRDHPSRLRGVDHAVRFQKLSADQLRTQQAKLGLSPAPNRS